MQGLIIFNSSYIYYLIGDEKLFPMHAHENTIKI